MAQSKVLLLMDEIERKWPLNGRYGPARGWDRRWWKLKEVLAAQQLAEADRACRCSLLTDPDVPRVNQTCPIHGAHIMGGRNRNDAG